MHQRINLQRRFDGIPTATSSILVFLVSLVRLGMKLRLFIFSSEVVQSLSGNSTALDGCRLLRWCLLFRLSLALVVAVRVLINNYTYTPS